MTSEQFEDIINATRWLFDQLGWTLKIAEPVAPLLYEPELHRLLMEIEVDIGKSHTFQTPHLDPDRDPSEVAYYIAASFVKLVHDASSTEP